MSEHLHITIQFVTTLSRGAVYFEGEGEGLGEGMVALSRDALMALKSTMEVYLLSLE